MSPALRALRRRLDSQAYGLLNEELARLAQENEELRTALAYAEDDAEHWRRQALEMYEAQAGIEGGAVGITQAGCLIVMPAMEARA